MKYIKIYVASVGDQVIGIIIFTVVGCLYFIIEGNDKFQLEVSESKDLIFPPHPTICAPLKSYICFRLC